MSSFFLFTLIAAVRQAARFNRLVHVFVKQKKGRKLEKATDQAFQLIELDALWCLLEGKTLRFHFAGLALSNEAIDEH